MTREDVVAATAEAAEAATQLADHLDRMIGRLRPLFPVPPATIATWGDEERERLHAMLRMFDQLYDLSTRKLFRGFLFLSGEQIGGLSAQNQFRKVEALDGIPSAERWIALATTRNILAHDYPTRAVDQAARANLAWNDLPDLIAGTRLVVAAIHREGLI